jgi:hypothetical protein
MVKRRTPDNMPPSGQWIRSPYDPEVRYGRKRGWDWMGYKVHLSESCDEGSPHLITNVLTTPATTPDFEAAAPIHHSLASKDLLPAEHLIKSLAPMYLGKTASFILEVEPMDQSEAEAEIEKLCREFENNKEYLVTSWK